MPVSISGTNGVTFPDSSLQAAAASPYTLKNRLINGDFRIDQRNAGASINNNTSGSQYSLDRWAVYGTQASKFSVQQNAGSVTPPVGFTNYLGATVVAAVTPGAADDFTLYQIIEGNNIADLTWGTANAKTITLSFWVRSSVTGTYYIWVTNGSQNRSYPASYTISSANTWTQISITIPGDTSGTWATNNTAGLQIWFDLGSGSNFTGTANTWQAGAYIQASGAVKWISNAGATFYITGVQLEQNTSATPFERRLYNQELANCQRYYWKITGGGSFFGVCPIAGISANQGVGQVQFPVTMRTSPTGITVSGTFTAGSAGFNPTVTIDTGITNTFCLGLTATATGSMAQFRAYDLISLGSSTNFIEVTGTEL